jgi:hypothetical protein
MKRHEALCFPSQRPLAACLALALAIGAATGTASAAAVPRGARVESVPVWLGAGLRSLQASAASRSRARPFADWPRQPSGGPTVVVQNCDDSGPGSLRDAYFNAVDTETIDLGQLACSTITLTTGALTDSSLATTVQLDGPGKYQPLVIDGANAGRVLVHNGSGELILNGLSITRGSYSGTYGGGCIYSYGDVTATGTTVSACSMSSSGTAKAFGGAIYALGAIKLFASEVTDSTAHAATADSAGAGVWAHEVQIALSTISGNTVSGDGSHYARGGGVFVLGDAQIKYSTIADNEAISGAGAFFVGAATYPMLIINSTISGNHAIGAAGGVYSKYRPLQVGNSTIVQNTAGFEFGAGLYLATNTELESTIVANNTSQDGLYASDIGGVATVTLSGANNLVIASTLTLPADTLSADPMLGPLQDNGGLSMTHALLPGSPALDHGNSVSGVLQDQRLIDPQTGAFYERVVGAGADIGAFEFGAPDYIFADGFD